MECPNCGFDESKPRAYNDMKDCPNDLERCPKKIDWNWDIKDCLTCQRKDGVFVGVNT